MNNKNPKWKKITILINNSPLIIRLINLNNNRKENLKKSTFQNEDKLMKEKSNKS